MKLNLRLKHKPKGFLLATILLLCTGLVQAQNLTVTGTVNDSGDGSGIPGVSILVKGSSTGTITDFDGKYSIQAKKGSTLVFSFVGYSPKEVQVTSAVLDVKLGVDTKSLEAVVVVGYGSQKKKVVTGAVNNVEAAAITRAQTADLGASLQGQVAGVNIQQASGSPGETANIQIRGLGTVNTDGQASGPLFVVDGIPQDGDPQIAPEQIESVDILKDGASASVYGVRASNGVILITTKKGKEGKLAVNFSTYQGIQNITSGTPLMGVEQQLYFEEIKTNALGRQSSIIEANNKVLANNTNFIDEIQNDNATVSNYNVNISGGSKSLTLNANANYFTTDGVLINSGFERMATRLTGELKKNKFKAFFSFGYTDQTREREPWGLYEQAIRQMPFNTSIKSLEITPDGGVIVPDQNAITFSYLSRILNNTDIDKVKRLNLALNASYEILSGLSYSVRLGYNSTAGERTRYEPRYILYDRFGKFSPSGSNTNARLRQQNRLQTRSVWENLLSYNKKFGNHDLSAQVMFSYEEATWDINEFEGRMSEEVSNDIRTIGALSSSSTPSGDKTVDTATGKLFRLQYDYAGKYMISASIRRDGTSKFRPENRYENFPGVSLGWNISEENFFKIKPINLFKLRASYASVGNSGIRPYSTETVIESGIYYPFGIDQTQTTGLIQRRLFDPSLKWESALSKNIGVDLGMFDNRLQLNVDLYMTNKSDMLLPKVLPLSSGTAVTGATDYYGIKYVNGGDMVNKGIEVALSYRNQTRFGLKYSANFTFTRNINEMTNLSGIERGYPGGVPISSINGVEPTTFLALGHEAGAFFLIETDGVFRSQDEIDAYTSEAKESEDKRIQPDAKPGDLKLVDTNKDGLIDDNDRVYKGSGTPKFDMGLNINLEYKNFDFYLKGYYSYGATIYNGSKLFAYTVGRHADLYSAWSEQNPTSDVPIYTNQEHTNVRSNTDRWLEDGTYLRISTITLGYNVRQLKKFGIDKARVFVSSVNPFTFTKYTGYDPEVGGSDLFMRGVDRGNYPIARQFRVGAQLNF